MVKVEPFDNDDFGIDDLHISSKRHKTRASTNEKVPKATDNGIGTKIVIPLPNGKIFVLLWIDGGATLRISTDGMSILQETEKPNPSNAQDLLRGLFPGWADQETNYVVVAVNKELKSLKKTNKRDSDIKVVVEFDEPVMNTFFHVDGQLDDRDQPSTFIDDDGRQSMAFFVQTLSSHRLEDVQKEFSSPPVSSRTRSNTPMDQDSNMEARLNNFNQEMRAGMQLMQQTMATTMQQFQQAQQQQIQQQQQHMQQMQQQQQQAQQQQMQMHADQMQQQQMQADEVQSVYASPQQVDGNQSTYGSPDSVFSGY